MLVARLFYSILGDPHCDIFYLVPADGDGALPVADESGGELYTW